MERKSQGIYLKKRSRDQYVLLRNLYQPFLSLNGIISFVVGVVVVVIVLISLCLNSLRTSIYFGLDSQPSN